jgi:hypothetical protein
MQPKFKQDSALDVRLADQKAQWCREQKQNPAAAPSLMSMTEAGPDPVYADDGHMSTAFAGSRVCPQPSQNFRARLGSSTPLVRKAASLGASSASAPGSGSGAGSGSGSAGSGSGAGAAGAGSASQTMDTTDASSDSQSSRKQKAHPVVKDGDGTKEPDPKRRRADDNHKP